MAKSRAEYIREHGEEKITFSIIEEGTVKKLKREGKIDLPYKAINVPKDKRWNEKQMASKLLHSIENGDSIPKLAQSLTEVIGNNMNSAIRNARTMTTAAENGGRLDSYKNLDEQGVVQKKVWEATPDDRTRPSHIDIDGEEQDINVPFSNGCMFPADGKGPAEEVWMCRCAMKDYIIGFRRKDGSISRVEGDRGRTMHDEQMNAQKERRNNRKKNNKSNNLTIEEKAEILSYKSFDYYEINEILRNDGIDGLSKLQKEKVRTLDSALYKLPNYEGDLTRSLYFYNEDDLNNFISKCQKDKTLKSKAYVSTSKNVSEYYNSDAQVQILIKDSKHGRDLEGYDNGENEVLYSRNSDFKIIKQGWENNIYVIIAKERWHKWQI